MRWRHLILYPLTLGALLVGALSLGAQAPTARDTAFAVKARRDLDSLARDKSAPAYSKRAQTRLRARVDSLLRAPVVVPVPVPAPVPVPPAPVPSPAPTPPDSGALPTRAELPRVTPAFTVPAATRTVMVPAPGLVRSVLSTITFGLVTAADLQGALDTAQPGDSIVLASGATYEGNFVLPTRPCGSWVTVTSAAAIPAAGTRVTPASAAAFAKITTPDNQPALRTAIPTCGWRLDGLEITGTLPITSVQYGLLALGDGGWVGGGEKQTTAALAPRDIILSHLYVHGTPTLNTVRCLALNSQNTIVRDSWISECHAKGFDSQAIESWNTPGVLLIENNTASGAGENIMFGGADPAAPELIPADITIRRNHVVKDPAWKGVWSVKNLFELKNARRVLAEGNVFENSWPDAQSGMAIVIKSTTDVCGAGCLWEGTQDVVFRWNIVKNAHRGLNLQAYDNSYTATGSNVHVCRVEVTGNLFTGIGTANGVAPTDGWLLLLTHDLCDTDIRANTFIGNTPEYGIALSMAYAGGSMAPMRRVSIRDNILAGQSYYAIRADDAPGYGTAAMNFVAGTSWTFSGNIVTEVDAEYQAGHPAGNTYLTTVAALGLTAAGALPVGSPYAAKGVDYPELLRRTAGVVVP